MRINHSRRLFLKAAGIAGSLPLLSSRLVFAQDAAVPRDVLVVAGRQDADLCQFSQELVRQVPRRLRWLGA